MFIGDEIDNNTIGLYATFALRNQKFKETYDMTGFSAISQYCYIKIFEILLNKNIKYVNLGGSEIKDLNDFKKQLGAKEKKTHWLYKKNEN